MQLYGDPDNLLARYADGSNQLRAAVAGLRDTQFDEVPIPGKWSVRYVICHLTDFEIVSCDRIQRVLADDNPTLADMDPNTFVPKLAYDQRPVEDELTLIEGLRKRMLRILQSCDLEDFQRTAVHSVDGPMTLEALVERSAWHIPHHIRFIEDKVAVMND